MSLIEGTIDAAIEQLAKRAADLRTRPSTYAEKVAEGASDLLGGRGEHLKNNPTLMHSLIGGAAGAGLGGIGTAVSNLGKEKEDRRSILGSALTGGLAGTAVGAGASLAHKGIEGMLRGHKKEVDPRSLQGLMDYHSSSAPVPLGGPERDHNVAYLADLHRQWLAAGSPDTETFTNAAGQVQHDYNRVNRNSFASRFGQPISGASQPVTFRDSAGKLQQLDPDALRVNPQLAEQVRQMSAPPGVADSAIERTLGGAFQTGTRMIPGLNPLLNRLGVFHNTANPVDNWLDKNIPISGHVLPGIASADAIAHTFNTGNITPWWTGHRGFGRTSAHLSTDPAHASSVSGSKAKELAPGLEAALTGHASNDPTLNATREGAHVYGTDPLSPTGRTPGDRRAVTQILAENNRRGNLEEPVMAVNSKQSVPARDDPMRALTKPKQPPASDKLQSDTLRRGQYQDRVAANVHADPKFEGNKLTGRKGLMRFGKHTYAMPGFGAQIGGRIAGYGGFAGGEYLIRRMLEQQDRENALRNFEQLYSKPIGAPRS
jgi:hypothetical protein